MTQKIKPTGNAEIDRQHAILDELATHFRSVCPDRSGERCALCTPQERHQCLEAVEALAERMLLLLAGHANYEERLMGLLPDNPHCLAHVHKHKEAHSDFVRHLRTLADHIDEDDPRSTSDRMHQLISHWLGEHATQFDEPLLAELGDRLPNETEYDEELVSILDQYVFHGRPTRLSSHLHDTVTRQQVEERLACLTPRQREICALVAQGLTNKAISDRLGITLNTTKTHRAEIYRKLGVSTLLELVLVTQVLNG
ncbi:MAG: Tetrathionate response regulatory protein TtrR [Alphaproteobacteria bacterium ADurb.BinA280]|jgi:hemerythrin-like metal-binding protein|nr:MAG: Tetrathionate response regulatory protein TtrR [Alphaproteobacteria bacterium ADurb.BinA280]